MWRLAERHLDVSARTVLNWVQTFGPQLATALRTNRRRVGRTWMVDEVFCFRGKRKLYLYRAVVRSVPSKWRRARDEGLRLKVFDNLDGVEVQFLSP